MHASNAPKTPALLAALLLGLPLGSTLVAGPAAPSGAAEPGLATAASTTQQGRGRASGSRGRGAQSGKGAGSRLRSIAGRAPTGGLLGPTRKPDVVPMRDEPSLEDFVQRAPQPLLEETPYIELAEDERLGEWFATADYDQNSWVSFREASAALEFDRARFRLYDLDRDGRMARAEFDAFYTDSMRLFGSFLAPEPPPTPTKARPRTPEQLRNAYDRDLDGALSLFELARLLNDYRRLELVAGEVLRYVDRTGDELLDVNELVDLQGYLYPITSTPEAALETAARPASIEELFDLVEPRGVDTGGTPYPPHIVGPIHPLKRLDLDGDGQVSATDLEELLRPVRVGVRPVAVLHTLDSDGDGQLSFEELEGAFLGKAPR